MIYTNKLNLPEPLVNALKHDEYSAGHSDYTPSSMWRPAYQQKLESLNEPKCDVSDLVYSTMGKAVHQVIENAGVGSQSYFSEERIYMKFENWTISMMFDSLYLDAKKGILDDYKTSTTYKFTKDNRGAMQEAPDWEFQLNVGAYILRKGGYVTQPIPLSMRVDPMPSFKKIPFSPIHINEIRIIGILKDFYKSKAKRDRNYPQAPIQIRSFSIWPDEKIEGEMRTRCAIRDTAKKVELENITPCNKEETWATDDTWALMKEKRKSAVKLFKTKDSLETWAFLNGVGTPLEVPNGGSDEFEFLKGHYTEFRPGERKRCDDYCNVSYACPAYKKFKASKK